MGVKLKNMKKIYILHGWGGDPDGAWKPWLKKELENLGHHVEVPSMPNSNNPVISEWLEKMNKDIINPNEDTILIGHSLGGLAILKYLETIPENIKIDKVILVASVIDSIKDMNESQSKIAKPWLADSLDSKKIISSSNKIIGFFSDNDPYIPLESSEIVKNKLKGEVISEHNGHYNEESNVYEVPQILKAITE